MLIATTLCLLSACLPFGPKSFSTEASYVVASNDFPGLVVRSGGRVEQGADISEHSFAYLKFRSLERETDGLLLCRVGGETRWFKIPVAPKRGVVLTAWIAENKTGGEGINWRRPWFGDAAWSLGVRGLNRKTATGIQKVIDSHLNGPKGTAIGDQISGEGITELSVFMSSEPAEAWVAGMLEACGDPKVG